MHDSIVIAGPTASGKTATAIAVAHKVGGEIISVDSRQVYRRMDIGTAKPSLAEREGIPHHGFDIVDPKERFNAGRFAALARGWIREIAARGRVPILTGGTGFFLRGLTHPLFEEPPDDARRRDTWKDYLAGRDIDTLNRWADALDPGHGVRPGDRQRLARIVEVALATGRPLSWWQLHAPPPPPAIAPLVFVVDLPRDLLVQRIDSRVDAMLEAGLVDEVRALIDAGYTERDPGMKTTGYIELIPFLRGECTLDAAADQIRAATRQYARRQRTWLRHQLPAGSVWVDGTQPVESIADRVAAEWRAARHSEDSEAVK